MPTAVTLKFPPGWLQLVITARQRPKVERQTSEFINFRNGRWVTREVHDRKITVACIAGLNPQMRKLGSAETGKLCFPGFVASGASCSGERPPPQAQRTNKLEHQSFRLRPEATGLGRLPAPRAIEARRKIGRIGLEQGASEEFHGRKRSRRFPVFANQFVELCEVQVPRGLRKSGRAGARHEIEE